METSNIRRHLIYRESKYTETSNIQRDSKGDSNLIYSSNIFSRKLTLKGFSRIFEWSIEGELKNLLHGNRLSRRPEIRFRYVLLTFSPRAVRCLISFMRKI